MASVTDATGTTTDDVDGVGIPIVARGVVGKSSVFAAPSVGITHRRVIAAPHRADDIPAQIHCW